MQREGMHPALRCLRIWAEGFVARETVRRHEKTQSFLAQSKRQLDPLLGRELLHLAKLQVAEIVVHRQALSFFDSLGLVRLDRA